jgi:hypothetical protein
MKRDGTGKIVEGNSSMIYQRLRVVFDRQPLGYIVVDNSQGNLIDQGQWNRSARRKSTLCSIGVSDASDESVSGGYCIDLQ